MGLGVSGPHRIQGCGTILRAPYAGLTSYRHPDTPKRAAVLEAVKAKASGGPPEKIDV